MSRCNLKMMHNIHTSICLQSIQLIGYSLLRIAIYNVPTLFEFTGNGNGAVRCGGWNQGVKKNGDKFSRHSPWLSGLGV